MPLARLMHRFTHLKLLKAQPTIIRPLLDLNWSKKTSSGLDCLLTNNTWGNNIFGYNYKGQFQLTSVTRKSISHAIQNRKEQLLAHCVKHLSAENFCYVGLYYEYLFYLILSISLNYLYCRKRSSRIIDHAANGYLHLGRFLFRVPKYKAGWYSSPLRRWWNFCRHIFCSFPLN